MGGGGTGGNKVWVYLAGDSAIVSDTGGLQIQNKTLFSTLSIQNTKILLTTFWGKPSQLVGTNLFDMH